MAVTHPAAGTALPPASRYCGFIHGPCTCTPRVCPSDGFVPHLSVDGELELSACLCDVCTESGVAA